ncbi:serine hydrolase domain-containing protein [Nocardioides sp. R1-1]|uniref:serine hydrolase domain-containing protein n=1 Tax=Nocardioides sp. R1-1 TaxID=3383502 RepID=UPI0038D1F9A2
MRGIGEWLRERLPELLEETGVPAAAVAVVHGDELVDAAAGTLSTATGVAATTDAIFQIGSITKVLTATLVHQLVEEGLVELDRPARTWLPDLRLGDEGAAATVTVRQLLTHTAGFEGDVFTDTGKGDDCLERYVDLLADVPQLFPPGAMWSYNNAAFCVLGRLVEVVRGAPYDACLRAHLLAPLGLSHAATDPYEAVLHRVAVGHVETAHRAGLHPTTTWALARSNAPAGSMLAMRARDLVAFARHHLTAPALAAMRAPQVALPDIGQGEAWGLGWELFRLAPTPVVGHDGNTIGQSAFLRLLPEHDLAVAVLTNGGDGKRLHRAIAGHVLRTLADVELPGVPDPPATRRTPEPLRYAGTYVSDVAETVVSGDAHGRLWLRRTPRGVLAEIDEPPYRTELVAWRGDTLWPVDPEGGTHQPVAFLGDDGTGRAAYLHTGRADRRVS